MHLSHLHVLHSRVVLKTLCSDGVSNKQPSTLLHRRSTKMIRKFCQIGPAIIAALSLAGTASQAFAQAERFEITGIKAVRPTLVNTIAALQAGDVARARAAFEAYDSAWNGIEVYVNVRSKLMYQTLEHEFQADHQSTGCSQSERRGAARRRPGNAG